MPRVTPFYAVKCNPDAAIMRCLAALGCGYDCASAREMADVLAMGVPPRRIIFAAPCKRPADLAYAVAAGVTVRLRSHMSDVTPPPRSHAPQSPLALIGARVTGLTTPRAITIPELPPRMCTGGGCGF